MYSLIIAALLGQQPIINHNAPSCPICEARTKDHYGKRYPAAIIPVQASVCRVTVYDRAGRPSAGGSGVLVAGEPPMVLTAAHVASHRVARVRVTFGKDSYLAKPKRVSSQSDACALVLDVAPRGVKGVQLAQDPIKAGEHLYACGLGTNGKYAVWVGVECTQLDRHDWLEMSGRARSGDSGGPVFVVRDGKARLIGNLWGTGINRDFPRWRIIATRLHVTNTVLKGKQNATNPSNPRPGNPRARNLPPLRPVRPMLPGTGANLPSGPGRC